MEDLVTITVDGEQIRVPKGTLLWEACNAHGIDIPIFCYHTKLGPVGACRTCLVEVEGMTKGPITACSTPVTDGMIVRTQSPTVEKAQRGIFEFLLLNHPLDCPICDRGGECPLQDQTFSYGPGFSRYIEPKRHHVKPIALGPTIALDRGRCVLCWRCVRFCAEVAEDKSIVLLERGDHSMVGTFQDQPYVSNFSGNVIELCPVGALTSRKQRFNFRPWELTNRPSVCPHCAFGCNLNVSVRKNDEVIRFLSRDNPEVDDSWLCDRGRFNFEFINSPERIGSPLIRQGDGFVEASWGEALDLIAERLTAVLRDHGPGAVAGVASPRLTNEDLYVFRRFMTDVLGTPNIDHHPRSELVLTSVEQEALRDLDSRLAAISDLDSAKTILVLGADPSRMEPVLELRIRHAVNRHRPKLVVVHSEEITLSSKANGRLSYADGAFADVAAVLANLTAGRPVPRPLLQSVTGDARAIAEEYLREGPVVVIYDDNFDGVTDKGAALLTLADFVGTLASRVDVGVIPLLSHCNSMGARDLDILPRNADGASWGAPLTETLLAAGSPVRAAIVLGSNLARDLAAQGARDRLEALDFLVVSELMMTDTARLADVILPAASFAEKAGTFTNTERRVQRLSTCVPSPGIARADWQALVDLSQYFDTPLDYALPQQIWDDIRRETRQYGGISYADIGPRGARAASLQPV